MGDQTKIDQPFWMQGNFAPVAEEITTTDLKVTGEIPRELNCLLYTSPSPRDR